MATPWDRAADGYVAEWLPRFTPYHIDLLKELAIQEGQRVLVPCCGTGAEVVAVARDVGPQGVVRATDSHEDMVRASKERARGAGFPHVRIEKSSAEDASGGPWDAIVCAFGLWQLDHRVQVLHAWRETLAPNGKVGVITWGPPGDDDPFELMSKCMRELEPSVSIIPPRILSERDSMVSMFEEAGLSLVRHTVVRHTLSFLSAEAFVTALRQARIWHDLWADLGEERMGMVVASFYAAVGGPSAPLPWDPPATLAVAALPGAEVALNSRPSVRAPSMKK